MPVLPMCRHASPRWNLAPASEAGWSCGDCRTVLGFRPDLDRSETRHKVQAVLLTLHDMDLLYIGNATEGELVCAAVAARCHREDRFDQVSIARFILDDPTVDAESHAMYWAQRASGDIPAPVPAGSFDELFAASPPMPARAIRRRDRR